MATRPSFVSIDSGVETWLSDMNDALDAVFNAPFPIPRFANFAAFPDAALYDQCLGLDQSSGLIYISDGTNWDLLISSNIDRISPSWTFASSQTASGTFYVGGFYDFATTDDDFSPSAVSFGTANSSYAAHVFVVLGAAAVDEITITVTGTRIQDDGTRTTSYAATITIPNGSAVDSYFETSEKFIGQVTIETTAGTAKTCNYGWCKYWDAFNQDFVLDDLEATWMGGANDSSADIIIRHHKTTGWTFNTGAAPTPPSELTSLQGSHVTEYEVRNGENGAWKRTGISQTIYGSTVEGIIIEVSTSVSKTFDFGNVMAQLTLI